MNNKIIISLILFIYTLNAQGQSPRLSGRVASIIDDSSIAGVNIRIKNSAVGTITNSDGKYSIDVGEDDILVFSFVGFESQEIGVKGQTLLNIKLIPATQQLDQIVVTALGFEEQKDKFSSASSNIKGMDLLRSGETSIITGLSGKVPGVIISRSSGDPGAGAYIQIRGQSSITGNLQPLVVIDGVPVYNSSFSDRGILAGSGELNTQTDGVVQQSRLNDINPEDVASVEVLRGASAAALWGTRAANGVLVITTKKGKNTGNKPSLSFRTSYSIDEVNKLPDLQRSYGQGVNGLYFSSGPASIFSWGDKISTREGRADDFLEQGEPGFQGFATFKDGSTRFAIAPGSPANPHGGKKSKETYDHAKENFKRGYTLDQSLSLSGGDENSNYYLSLGNTNTQGIIRENSDYNRTTLRLNTNRNFGNKLSTNMSLLYSNVNSNRIQQGNNQDGLLIGALRTPPDFNNSNFEGDFTNAAGEVFPNRHISYRNPIGAVSISNPLLGFIGNAGFANPFWTMNHIKNNTKIDRILGSLELSYKFTNWLSLLNRTGMDRYTDHRSAFYPSQSTSFLTGSFRNEQISESQINNDLILRASREINRSLGLSLLGGFNLNHREANQVGAQVSNLINPFSPPQLSNSSIASRSPFNAETVIRTGALYGQLDVEAFKMFYFTFTGRGENASTFGKAQKTFFYPSSGAAWQFTNLKLFENSKILNFGKLRASFGVVGIQPGLYQTLTYYSPADNGQINESFDTSLDAVAFGGGFVQSSIKGNNNLEPERKTEWEVGTDLRFFNNRVSLSGTYYQNRSKGVILPVPLPVSSGFSRTFDNAAEIENKGIELNLNATILRTSDFSWSTTLNWSKNENKVVDLKGAESVILAELPGISIRAVEGHPLGVLWGTRQLRDDKGNLALGVNGFPQLDFTEGVIGNPNPNWRAGIGSTLSYKKFSLYALFDHVHDMDLGNATKATLYFFGTHKDTEQETTVSSEQAGTIKNFSGKPLNQIYPTNPDGSVTYRGSIKDFGGGPVALDQTWYQGLGGGFVGPADQFKESINVTRLRELTLSYNLSTAGFQNITRLQSVDFAITGRNLLLWTNYSGIDPETNLTGVSNARGLDASNNPSTRSLIFSIRINY